MALIGYARVSTAEQDTALQTDALRKAGCERVFEDTASGAKADRPGLADALAYLRDGDVLAVWRLDRLGRSLPHLIETIGALEARGVGFRSLTEAIDTTTPGGRLIFHVFGALGQFERDLIRERTKAGLTAAAARGRKGRTQAGCHRRQVAAGAGAHRQRAERPRGRYTAQGEQDGPVCRAAIGQCSRLLIFRAVVF
jgi:DNA invertase Pin-like site-specific DNA recombinase